VVIGNPIDCQVWSLGWPQSDLAQQNHGHMLK
jgi:hypothetical protein